MKGLILFINVSHNRDYSELDTKRALQVFPKLGYEFIVYRHDVSKTDLTLILNNAVRHMSTAITPFDCLIVFVAAHGDSDYLHLRDDSFMSIEEIVRIFLPRNCPVLADKQKMFFFQNCRKYSCPQTPSRKPHIKELVQSTGNILIALRKKVTCHTELRREQFSSKYY